MNLLVNGNAVQVPEEVETISDVMMHFDIKQLVVVVEQNGEIIDRSIHPTKQVLDGDKIEIVQFVGGG